MGFEDLAFAGAARQAELLRLGEVSSRELVEGYLERIGRLEPRVNAFRAVYFERALAEADQADAGLRAGDERPLLGVPIAIKDNVDLVGDVTGHGTREYGEPAAADSEVVTRLRAAGAVVLGKTHLPELAIWPFTESASWGVTRNPWSSERTAGGSSGGSAAAVAAGLAPLALASDGGGSIRIPAACCGLFGIKPQRGRVSLAPLREHWHGLTALGPLARRVIDAALFLDAAAGPAPGDADVPPPPPRPFLDSARSEPERLRVAVSYRPPMAARVADEALRPVLETADLLRSLGHDVVEHEPRYGELRTLFAPRWLRGIHDDSHTLIAGTRQLERRTRQMIAAGSVLTPAVVQRARRAESALLARLAATFDSFEVLLTPTLAQPPVAAGRWEGRGALRTFLGVANWTPFTVAWNVTGQPAAVLPAGFSDGLPLAVQLVGRSNDEGTLLALAAQIERVRPWADRRPEP